jgi:hypothetical protein
MFVPPKKKNDNLPAKAQQPATKNTKETATTAEEKEDSKWNVLDSCCFAPYKVLFAPVTMVAKAVANKVK